jgi:hypothetical protein
VRRLLLGILLGAGIVGGGTAAYLLLFRAEPDAPVWILSAFSGKVEVSSGGEWAPATVKARLANTDRIRTGEDGEAMLLHQNSHVTVKALTELEISSLTEESSRFKVSEGNVLIEARADRISVRTPSGARVDATEAGLGMSVQADGDVMLQVARGAAELSSMGSTETVSAGQQSVAHAGQRPTAPVPIPAAILLNVRFPDADTFNTRLTHVSGTTEPHNRVMLDGRWVTVGEDGKWEADVELAEGVNQLEVVARDPLGREKLERSAPLHVDVTAPTLTSASIGSRATTVARGGGSP